MKHGSSRLQSRLRRIAAGGLRVQVYLLVVAGSCLVGAATAAQRAGHKVELQLGERLLSRLTPLAGQTEHVSINGADFSFASVALRGSVEPILATFEQDCHDHAGDLAERFGELSKQGLLKKAVPELDPKALTTLRRDGFTQNGKKVGEVACAMRDGGPGIMDRLQAFAESGNLSELGKLRYIRADSEEGSDATRLLAIWTDDPLDLDRLFPEQGDAAGTDPSGVERPPASRRTFSGVVARSGDGAYGYTSELSPEQVLGFYAAKLPAQGWLGVNLNKAGEADTGARAYHRDGRALVVSAGRGTISEPTDVALSIMEARRVIDASE